MDKHEYPLIIVRFTAVGFHSWPDAPDRRIYLRARHRHLFYVEVTTAVQHNDREIEFHDLLDSARQLFPGGELGNKSCETMALGLASALAVAYERPVRVSVFEDNEVGASVWVRPE